MACFDVAPRYRKARIELRLDYFDVQRVLGGTVAEEVSSGKRGLTAAEFSKLQESMEELRLT